MTNLNEKRISELLLRNKNLGYAINYAQENYLKAVADNNKLCQLLKECDSCIRALRAYGVSDCNGSELNDLLTRINAAINEREK